MLLCYIKLVKTVYVLTIQKEGIMPNLNDMDPDDVRKEIRHICATSQSEEQVKERIRDELGYAGTPAVTSTRSYPMIMFMVMVHHPSGVISV